MGLKFNARRVGYRGMVSAFVGMLVVVLGLILAGCGGSSAGEAESTQRDDQSNATQADQTQTPVADGADNTVAVTQDLTSTVVYGGKSKEEYQQAIPALEEKLQESPEDLTLLQELAIAQYNGGEYEAAAQTYQKMITIEDQPVLHNNLANVLRDWGKTDEARAEYQKAIDADPKLAVAYINLATILAHADDKAGAIQVLEEGIGRTEGEDKERLQGYKDQLSKAE
ncbi:MAG: tetratricopeptide repeat protein [Actinobacteria bacterium]|nr:tetratricopeptide repeat protein [Actinomycetota bacterium]